MISVPLDTLANKLFRNKGKGLSLFLSYAKLRNKTETTKHLDYKKVGFADSQSIVKQ